MKVLDTPLSKEQLKTLKAGDNLQLSGKILVARDAAHKRLSQELKEGNPLPIKLKNQIIYYMGPTPTPPGEIIGSCGPTSSYRMDPYTPELLDHGVLMTIGKGKRSEEVCESLRKNGSVYCVTVGGTGALLQQSILKSEILLYPELGPEAVYQLEVENFPLIIAIDTQGNSIFEMSKTGFQNLWKQSGGY